MTRILLLFIIIFLVHINGYCSVDNIEDDVTSFISLEASDKKSLIVGKQLIQKYRWLAVVFPQRFEELLINASSHNELKAFYESLPVKTNLGKILYNESEFLSNAKKQESLEKMQKNWVDSSFSTHIEERFIDRYAHKVPIKLLEKKIMLFLLHEKDDLASKLIKILPKVQQDIYVKLLKNKKDLKSTKAFMINSKYDFNKRALAKYFYIKQLNASNDYSDEYYRLLLEANYTDFASKWWMLKQTGIKNAIQEKKYYTALKLSQSNQAKSINFQFDSQWFAGFISLKFLKKPQDALHYFENAKKFAATSNSKSQIEYWIGRAYEALGDREKSINAFTLTALRYPSFFYGQISTLKITQKQKQYNIFAHGLSNVHKPKISTQKLHAIVIWLKTLYNIGYKNEAMQLQSYISGFYLDDQDIQKIVTWLNDTSIIVSTAKQLINRDNKIIIASYPQEECIKNINGQYHYLYLAITRQESCFDQNARSAAGAAGLMQLIPSTAGRCAKELNLKINDYDSNAQTNIKLGCYYLNYLMDLWSGNYFLAIASYNAGESAVSRWINLYGDPRLLNKHNDIVDWIALIPYNETRLYTKKVIENMINYKAVLSGRNSYSTLDVARFFDKKKFN